jgi:hypothetical protein
MTTTPTMTTMTPMTPTPHQGISILVTKPKEAFDLKRYVNTYHPYVRCELGKRREEEEDVLWEEIEVDDMFASMCPAASPCPASPRYIYDTFMQFVRSYRITVHPKSRTIPLFHSHGSSSCSHMYFVTKDSEKRARIIQRGREADYGALRALVDTYQPALQRHGYLLSHGCVRLYKQFRLSEHGPAPSLARPFYLGPDPRFPQSSCSVCFILRHYENLKPLTIAHPEYAFVKEIIVRSQLILADCLDANNNPQLRISGGLLATTRSLRDVLTLVLFHKILYSHLE